MKSYMFWVCFIVLSLSRATYCWLATNHAIIALVAKEHMSEGAQERVENLLDRPLDFPKVNPASCETVGITPQNLSILLNSIETASMWADVIKNYTWKDRPFKERLSKMHYLPVTFDLTEPNAWGDSDQIRRRVLKARQNNPDNIVDGIGSMIKAFTHHAASDDVRAIALRFLIHFMGDICQPLHAFDPVYREGSAPHRTTHSSGGCYMYFMNGGTPCGSFVTGPNPNEDLKRQPFNNMHLYFDGMLGICPQLPSPENSIYERKGLSLWKKNRSEYLRYLSDKAHSLPVVYDFIIPQPFEWILQTYIAGYEILILQKSLSYQPHPEEGNITAIFREGQDAFQRHNTPILHQLSFMAGIRLAKLLTALVDPTNADPRYLFLVRQVTSDPAIPPLLIPSQLGED